MQLLQVLTLTQRQLIQVQVLRLWREISVVAWVLSWNQRHIWLESVVASRPCSESSTMSRPPQNQHSKSQFYPENIKCCKLCLYLFDYETRRARPSQALAFVINAVFLLSSFLLFLFVRAELERQRRLHAMEVQSVEEARYRLRAQLSNVRVDH